MTHHAVDPADSITQARLERLAQWCRDGRLAGAELELHQWQRQADCPAAARVMLAALLARRGRLDDALAVLEPVKRLPPEEADPCELQMLVSLLIACDYPDAASRLGRRLFDAHGNRPEVVRWLHAMSVPGAQDLPATAEATIEHLAAELVAQPELAASLVAAFKHEPQPQAVELLRSALARTIAGFEGDARRQVMLCQALAELALVAGDQDDARRWAHRGLKLDPYAAPLALVLAQVSDDEAVGPSARQVLRGACERFPHYPDLRAALIRRAQADGASTEARRQLEQWLKEEPASPVAQQLARELAA